MVVGRRFEQPLGWFATRSVTKFVENLKLDGMKDLQSGGRRSWGSLRKCTYVEQGIKDEKGGVIR